MAVPPVPHELLMSPERPNPPLSGSPQDLLAHAAAYGAYCRKLATQLAGWQNWYGRQNGKQTGGQAGMQTNPQTQTDTPSGMQTQPPSDTQTKPQTAPQHTPNNPPPQPQGPTP